MLFPVVIEPQQLLPPEGEFDPTKIVACLCPNRRNALGRVKLVWADFGNDGPGWYACCSWECHLKHFTEGNAS